MPASARSAARYNSATLTPLDFMTRPSTREIRSHKALPGYKPERAPKVGRHRYSAPRVAIGRASFLPKSFKAKFGQVLPFPRMLPGGRVERRLDPARYARRMFANWT